MDLHSSIEGLISVGGVDTTDFNSFTNGYYYNLWYSSDYGLGVDIYAPAIVYFNYRNMDNKLVYNQLSEGTSFSSPIVAGVAATIISERKDIVFNSKIMLDYLQKIGLHDIIDGVPKYAPNVFINNGNSLVFSKNNEYAKDSCGVNAGLRSCDNNSCCSAYGKCTTSSDSTTCSTKNGCQSEFGYCNINTSTISSNNQYRCGFGFGNCPKGYCCSLEGYCGTTYEYCDAGCQSNYGQCQKTARQNDNSSYDWVPFEGSIPKNAISLKQSNGHMIAVCRGNIENSIHVGYVNETLNVCSIGYGGKEYQLENFKILIGDMDQLKWIEWKPDQVLTGYKLIEGGYESKGTLYICKVTNDSDKMEYFGKTSNYINGANYSYNGDERNSENYVVLVEKESKSNDDSYYWVPFDGNIPENAITLNNGDDNTVAICRSKYGSSEVYPGYVEKATKLCSFSVNHVVKFVDDFEILISNNKNKLQWIEWNSSKPITGYSFVVGGNEKDKPIYPSKVKHSTGMNYFGKVSDQEYAYYAYNDNEYKSDTFSILVEIDYPQNNLISSVPYAWIKYKDDSVPENAITLKKWIQRNCRLSW